MNEDVERKLAAYRLPGAPAGLKGPAVGRALAAFAAGRRRTGRAYGISWAAVAAVFVLAGGGQFAANSIMTENAPSARSEPTVASRSVGREGNRFLDMPMPAIDAFSRKPRPAPRSIEHNDAENHNGKG